MHLCNHLQKHKHPQPLAAHMGFRQLSLFWECRWPQSHVSFGRCGCFSGFVCVTALFPRICCSLQSANPQTIKKALQWVTCSHLSCKSMPAAPQNAVAPTGVQLSQRPSGLDGGSSGWQFLTLSGQVLIIALFHSSISYPSPVTNFHAISTLLMLMTSVFQESPCNSPFPFNPHEGHCLQHDSSAGATYWIVGGHTHQLHSYFCYTNCSYPNLFAVGGVLRQTPLQKFFRILSMCMYMDLVNMPSSLYIRNKKVLKKSQYQWLQRQGCQKRGLMKCLMSQDVLCCPCPCSWPKLWSMSQQPTGWRSVPTGVSAPCPAWHFSHGIPCTSSLISSVRTR